MRDVDDTGPAFLLVRMQRTELLVLDDLGLERPPLGITELLCRVIDTC
ncbi:MAG: hypothetical protein HC927_03190 [Deltaproteobacteria bacterium]|nr:hypothetical protein [Deltaproteobacteria bacterium]